MQITTALSLHTILAEEQFSLDELVIELRRAVQEEGHGCPVKEKG
jgi:hypothetical protein